MMQKDHRGPRAPVAERDHRARPCALTRETREAAAMGPASLKRGLSLRKILPRQRVANSLPLCFALTAHTRWTIFL